MNKKESGMITTGKVSGSTAPGRKRSVVRPKLHTAVVEYLLEDIQNGIYQEGQELPSEHQLMADFGVGRPAIRESLSTLERMGLISIRPGARARIRKPTVKPLLGEMRETMQIYALSTERRRELHEFRVLFESMLARELARKITRDQLDQLERSLMEQSSALGSVERFARLDVEFHRLLSDSLDNPLLGIFADSIADWLLDQRLQTLKLPGRPEGALAEHRAVFNALAQHDPDAAESSMRSHLDQVGSAYTAAKAGKRST